MWDVAGGDKRNKPHHFLYIKVGRKMKISDENLEIVDYEEEKDAKTGTVLGYEMMAKITLVDLVYNMNRNTCHKMNFIIIGAQWIILAISLICQSLFDEFKTVISMAGAVGSTILMCLVIINTQISDKAIKKANKQREIIEKCINEIGKKS